MRAILTNPLDQDPVLKDLLRKLDLIETRRGFARWKKHFLLQFESHLEGVSITKAGQKYHAFARRLDRLVLLLKALERLMSAGDLSATKVTVKSRQSLGELQKQLTGMIQHTQALIPGTLEQENQVGYTKFDMGAVLVRDGFVEYDRLCLCRDVLYHMTEALLREVADRQLLEEMERYEQHLEAFCGIMGNDLGLNGAMLKCRDILRSDDEEFYQYENENGVIVTVAASKTSSYCSEYDEEADEEDEDDEDEEEEEEDEEEEEEEDEEGDYAHAYQQQLHQQPQQEEEYESDSNMISLCGMVIPLRLTKVKSTSNGGTMTATSCYDDLSDNVSELSDDSGGSWYWSLTVPAPPKQRGLDGGSSIKRSNHSRFGSTAGDVTADVAPAPVPIPPPPFTDFDEKSARHRHLPQGKEEEDDEEIDDYELNQAEDEDEEEEHKGHGRDLLSPLPVDVVDGGVLELRDGSTINSTLTNTVLTNGDETNITTKYSTNSKKCVLSEVPSSLNKYSAYSRKTSKEPAATKDTSETPATPPISNKDAVTNTKTKKKKDSPKAPQRSTSDLTTTSKTAAAFGLPRRASSMGGYGGRNKNNRVIIIPAPPVTFPEFPPRAPLQPIPDAEPTRKLKWTLNDYYPHGGNKTQQDWRIAKQERKQLQTRRNSANTSNATAGGAASATSSTVVVARQGNGATQSSKKKATSKDDPSTPTVKMHVDNTKTTDSSNTPTMKKTWQQQEQPTMSKMMTENNTTNNNFYDNSNGNDDMSLTGSKKIVLKARLRKKTANPSDCAVDVDATRIINGSSGHSGNLDNITDDHVIIRRRAKVNTPDGRTTSGQPQQGLQPKMAGGASNIATNSPGTLNNSSAESDTSSRTSVSTAKSAGSDDLDVIQHRRNVLDADDRSIGRGSVGSSPSSSGRKKRGARRASISGRMSTAGKSSEMRRLARRALRRREQGSVNGSSSADDDNDDDDDDDENLSTSSSHRRRSRLRTSRRSSTGSPTCNISASPSLLQPSNNQQTQRPTKKKDPLHNLLFKHSPHQSNSSSNGRKGENMREHHVRQPEQQQQQEQDDQQRQNKQQQQQQPNYSLEQSSASGGKASNSRTRGASQQDGEYYRSNNDKGDDDDGNKNSNYDLDVHHHHHHHHDKDSSTARERRQVCYSWYGRLGQPSRDVFRRHVRSSAGDMDGLTEKDVDLLPWIHSGARINVSAMTKHMTH